jgi:hypothetical protein
MREHADQFAAFCIDENEGSFDTYLEVLSRAQTWAGEAEMQAMSMLFK